MTPCSGRSVKAWQSPSIPAWRKAGLQRWRGLGGRASAAVAAPNRPHGERQGERWFSQSIRPEGGPNGPLTAPTCGKTPVQVGKTRGVRGKLRSLSIDDQSQVIHPPGSFRCWRPHATAPAPLRQRDRQELATRAPWLPHRLRASHRPARVAGQRQRSARAAQPALARTHQEALARLTPLALRQGRQFIQPATLNQGHLKGQGCLKVLRC